MRRNGVKRKSVYTLKNLKLRYSSCAQTPFLLNKTYSRISFGSGSGLKSPFLELYKDYLSIKSGFLPPLWVFIMAQCCKITGFPQCFLLFVRLCHGNLEPVHVGDSGLSCKAPHSGIHDVSGCCAKAFLRLLSDSSAQELHCGDEEITDSGAEREN